ncbi:hypothetical protein AYM40_04615 [Paraburkholderia phytofirmans OLGA172]|uniref:Uncharacterized protein n=1 Tax=Paraburkholderia phytofirmans OLGA172 TaxID=1417228 RepID=A0A161HY39_9BURK|nr:hypothetical protein AYM40_04615 [Paraburkholderia phytofirmans OLGA172]
MISTGHAALESPEGIYISLYPGVEIDRSPDDFARRDLQPDAPQLFEQRIARSCSGDRRRVGAGLGEPRWLAAIFARDYDAELWVAAQQRKRATTMAWTPGLTLDYARAQHARRPASVG